MLTGPSWRRAYFQPDRDRSGHFTEKVTHQPIPQISKTETATCRKAVWTAHIAEIWQNSQWRSCWMRHCITAKIRMQTLTLWALTDNLWQFITQASQCDAGPALPKAPRIHVKVSQPPGQLKTDYPTAHSNEAKPLRSSKGWTFWDIFRVGFAQV